MHRKWIVFLLLMAVGVMAGGCIPARTPAVLDATAGSPVRVDGDRVITSAFVVRIPADWRVILGPADQPPSVTMVAPDDCTVIVTASMPIDAPPTLPEGCAPPITQSSQSSVLGGSTIYLAGSSTHADTLDAALSAAAQSLTMP